MSFLGRFVLGAATGALLTVTAVAADARPRGGYPGGYPAYPGGGWHYRDRGPSVGDILLGAAVIGGIAAVVASANKREGARDRGGSVYDDGYGGDYGDDVGRDYDRGGERWNREQAAVDRCVDAALDEVSRRYDNPRIGAISDVDQDRDTTYVRGTVTFDTGWRGSRPDVDSSSFRCAVRRDRVVNLNVDGLYAAR